jgi:hypothetical protein
MVFLMENKYSVQMDKELRNDVKPKYVDHTAPPPEWEAEQDKIPF